MCEKKKSGEIGKNFHEDVTLCNRKCVSYGTFCDFLWEDFTKNSCIQLICNKIKYFRGLPCQFTTFLILLVLTKVNLSLSFCNSFFNNNNFLNMQPHFRQKVSDFYSFLRVNQLSLKCVITRSTIVLPIPSALVFTVDYCDDQDTVVSGSADSTVRIWKMSTGHCLQTRYGHTDWVIKVRFVAFK